MPAHLLPARPFAQRHHPPPKLLDNLLRDYVGQHYTYDARGNLLERLENGKKARFTWDLYDRLTRYEDDRLNADETSTAGTATPSPMKHATATTLANDV